MKKLSSPILSLVLFVGLFTYFLNDRKSVPGSGSKFELETLEASASKTLDPILKSEPFKEKVVSDTELLKESEQKALGESIEHKLKVSGVSGAPVDPYQSIKREKIDPGAAKSKMNLYEERVIDAGSASTKGFEANDKLDFGVIEDPYADLGDW